MKTNESWEPLAGFMTHKVGRVMSTVSNTVTQVLAKCNVTTYSITAAEVSMKYFEAPHSYFPNTRMYPCGFYA